MIFLDLLRLGVCAVVSGRVFVVKGLAVEVSMPGGVRAGREPDYTRAQPRRRVTVREHVDPHVAGERRGRSLAGRPVE
jgi:hypothetical protein